MRLSLKLLCVLSLLIAKDIRYKIQQTAGTSRLVTLQGANEGQVNQAYVRPPSRDDTTTVWLEDFEGDLDGWEFDTEWELTDETSYSGTYSYHIDDDNYDVISSIISPVLSIPAIESQNETYKLNFALWCDLPDFDGDGDNYLEDYYWVDIANVSDVPIYFGTSLANPYDGSSWWCGDPGVGGYLDAWVQFLDSPVISVPADAPTLTTMLKWGIEDPAGAVVEGTCTDGWDAANVRISNDGGETWALLTGDDPYDFNYGFGWIYNDPEYDCGGSLGTVAAGWGGQADWHEVTFDLSLYAGQDVIIRFAFGSDPAYSTPDDNTLTGFQIDNIVVAGGSGEVVFIDNADDQIFMVPAPGMEFVWEQFFYDYGDITRPGGLGWEVYQPGLPFNGNAMMDLADFTGSDIRIRFTGRMDENDDGGNGTGLFIDDVHIWKVEVNNIPQVQNLYAFASDAQVDVTWDGPPGGSYDNDDVSFVDGTFEDGIWMSSGTSVMGTYFGVPYGADAVFANSVSIWGQEGLSGATILHGYDVIAGNPASTPTFTQNIDLTENTWNDFTLGWTFIGDFLLAIEVTTTVAISIDADNAPGIHSWANLGGWEPWTDVATYYGLTDGEFGIMANVTTVGGSTPVFNVYRSVDGGEFNLMFNGANLTETEYQDNLVQNGTEYCYQITTVYGEEESDPAGPACAMPEAQTIYEMAHDDGTGETSINAGSMNVLGVKFTPNNYPVDIYRASFYTVGSSNGVAFVNVWDDDGTDGLPGTALIENVPVEFSPGGWTPSLLSSYGLTIHEGSFYVGWMESPTTPPVGVDTDTQAENSFIDVDIGLGWEPFANYFDGALMIRVEVDSANVIMGLEDDISGTIPKTFGLNQNYPNPFNPTTAIEFDLASDAVTSLALYDVTGRKVLNLMNQDLRAGHYTFNLNAGDLPSGMYFYQLLAQDSQGSMVYSATKKLVLMK